MDFNQAKDLFSAVLGTAVEKGVEFAGVAAVKGKEYYELLKEKGGEYAGTAAERGLGMAGTAVEKTKEAGHAARLGLEVAAQKETLKKAYAALGKAFFEQYGGEFGGSLGQLSATVAEELDKLEEMEARLAEVKANLAPSDPDVEVSFEEIVEQTEQEADPEEPAPEEQE